MHTSTITVAVLPEPSHTELVLNPRDLEIKTCRGSGAGGQHRNVTDSAVQIKYLPTGLIVKIESERSQNQNKENALALLKAKLWKDLNNKNQQAYSDERRNQVGTGQRADKRRSYYYQRDEVVDHVLNRTWRLKDFLKGNW